MTIGGPRIFEGLLPLGRGRVLGYNHAAGMYYILERPAVGFPEIYWFDREEDLPPGVGEDVVGMLDEGEVFPPQEDNQVMSSDEEEEAEELDLLGHWESEDSGYESISEDEEDFEDDDEEDVRPRSPLVQQLPPGRPEQRAGPPPGGLPSEESAPSTSGLGSSAKRSREESDTEQVGTKRQRWSHDDSYVDSAPSTSGLGPSTFRRSWMRPLPSDDSDSD